MFSLVLPDQGVPGRPFTDPAWCEADFQIMEFMLQMVRESRGEAAVGSGHHLTITQPERLWMEPEPVVTGFFGHMQDGAEQTTLPEVQAVDHALIADFGHYPGLLSYSSLELPHGDWGNLAVFADVLAMETWSRNPLHSAAIPRLATQHYRSIRLHLGRLPGGLTSGRLEIVRTKFYQYEPGGTWRGLCQRG
jgi:hypothetical protein